MKFKSRVDINHPFAQVFQDISLAARGPEARFICHLNVPIHAEDDEQVLIEMSMDPPRAHLVDMMICAW